MDVSHIVTAINSADYDRAADYIIDLGDDLTATNVSDIMDAVRRYDSTDSAEAAMIRDTIRDNSGHDVI